MKFRFAIVSLVLICPSLIWGAEVSFPRTLQIGMSGDDVRALQIALNADVKTRIADVGPGSSGYETNYFGPATRRAVIKFQEEYKTDVLLPAGLTKGTGFFGEKTRAKANTLFLGVTIPKENTVSTSITTAGLPVTPDELTGVVVKTPSQYFAKPGTALTISGWGFTKNDNIVNFGDSYKVERVKSLDGYSLAFNVPSIPKGVYIVSVKNENGDSQTKTFFAVTDGTTVLPQIESITPEHAVRGDTVTIKGSGFARAGNMLRTTLKVFENLPSQDGVTISFVVPPDTFLDPPAGFSIPVPDATVKKAAVSLPIWVYAVNENGLSNGKSFIGDF